MASFKGTGAFDSCSFMCIGGRIAFMVELHIKGINSYIRKDIKVLVVRKAIEHYSSEFIIQVNEFLYYPSAQER